jgi:uncharacterized protein (DUF1501 family)
MDPGATIMLNRRHLLRLAAVPGAALLPVGRSAWAAQATTAVPPDAGRLVVVFLRGAVDGLSVLAPHADPHYQRARPTIALGRPGTDGGALALGPPQGVPWGLHPALAPLLPLWQSERLAFVHAAGSPDATRSHFDAQEHMESGTPGRKSTADGWMNRLLGLLPPPPGSPAAPTRAVSIGPVLPRIYAGPQPVANIATGRAATRPQLLDRPRVADAFDALYQGDDKLSRAYQEAQLARRDVQASLMSPDALAAEMQAASNGAPLPGGFPADAARLGTLMRNDARVQFAFMAVGGWDTHAGQGAATGQLASRLAPLGQGLATLAQRLGPALQQTVVVVMSEFGRTVRQNGNGGTDHGHGNVLWLLGGPVAGGRVLGAWPGLDDAALHEGRDLAVTTDFRQVLADIAQRHLRLPEARLTDLFPGFVPKAGAAAPRVLRA